MKTKVKEKERAQEKPDKDECHHYWIIEIADGPTSRGVCKYCGESREFLNAFPAFNPMKRQESPLKLPEVPTIEIDKESKS